MAGIALGIVVVLALIHLFADRLTFLTPIPRSRWLSFAGGVSVAYVFVHILPDLAEQQEALVETGIPGLDQLEDHVYLVALIGLSLFYGLERLVRGSQKDTGESDEPDPGVSRHVFWLHIASFSAYNVLIGYLLLHREESTEGSLLLFGVAMAFHFLVNDFGLTQDHRETYTRSARWILASAVVLGWLVGIAIELDAAVLAVLFSFLAGGIILNVLKEELPEERRSRFIPFALGVIVYAAVLLAA